MGEFGNSIRQIRRTPLRSGLFLILIGLSAMLLTLGVVLYRTGEQNMKRVEEVFVTIGLVSQKPDRFETMEIWDAEKRDMNEFSSPVYDIMLPPEALLFEGADYIDPPVHRPYYGAYDPSFVYPDNTYIRLIAQTREHYPIVEVTPLEDCVPDHTVQLKILRELYGRNGIAGREIFGTETILFCDHYNADPQTLYAGKTYVMALEWRPSHQEWVDTHTGVDALAGEFFPRSMGSNYLISSQYSPNGEMIPDSMPMEYACEEVTEGFYDTPRGLRWLELAKAMDMAEHTIPVIPTDNTQFLISFYNGNSVIINGRDISPEEYKEGQIVCLISQEFAKMHGYEIGDTVPLSLYYADYRGSASQDFPPDGLPMGNPNHLLNAQGKSYEVFEAHDYTVVGIYNEINKASYSSGYDMAGYGVVIPAASVKNSVANNILDYGPMKGYNTVFRIPNGSVERYLERWGKYGVDAGISDKLEITIYDKGYTRIKEGLAQIKQVAFALFISGLLVTVLILLFFSNLFIGKQKKRTAIERSLGMDKRSCTVSLLSGVMAIVALGSTLGSAAGYALSGLAMGLLSELSQWVTFSTEYSNWANSVGNAEEMLPATGTEGLLIAFLCGSSVTLLALGISLVQIRSNLRSEPLKLLSTRDA
ncbi:MAG: ABC transporter permease [Clostridiales bacterium]|nr:ABC transporter permease [Clostridiales bacterium]